MRKLIVTLFLLAIVGAYFVYPFATMHRLKTALAERDVAVMEALVDWRRVREGLRSDLRASFLSSQQDMTSKTGMEQAGAMLGMVLGGNLIDTMVDAAVSPTGIINALDKPDMKHEIEVRDAAFVSPTDFKIVLGAGGRNETVTVMMELSGTNWKVVRVLAPELLAAARPQP